MRKNSQRDLGTRIGIVSRRVEWQSIVSSLHLYHNTHHKGIKKSIDILDIVYSVENIVSNIGNLELLNTVT